MLLRKNKIITSLAVIISLLMQMFPSLFVYAADTSIPDSIVWQTSEVSWWAGFYFLKNTDDGKNLKGLTDSLDNSRYMSTVSGEGTPWTISGSGTAGKYYLGASANDNSMFSKNGTFYIGEFYYEYNRITNNEGIERSSFSFYELIDGEYVLASAPDFDKTFIIVSESNGKNYALSNIANTDEDSFLLHNYNNVSYYIKGLKGIEVSISDDKITGIVLSDEELNATPTPIPTATPEPTKMPIPEGSFTLYANKNYYSNIYGNVTADNNEGNEFSYHTTTLYTYDESTDTATKVEPETKVGVASLNTASGHNILYSFDGNLYGKEYKVIVNHIINSWGPKFTVQITYYNDDNELITTDEIVYSKRSESNAGKFNNVLSDKEIGVYKNIVSVKTTASGGGNGAFYAVTFEEYNSVPTPEPTATAVPTSTPVPTETPIPTNTPVPTETPVPTNTPAPTDVPKPGSVNNDVLWRVYTGSSWASGTPLRLVNCGNIFNMCVRNGRLDTIGGDDTPVYLNDIGDGLFTIGMWNASSTLYISGATREYDFFQNIPSWTINNFPDKDELEVAKFMLFEKNGNYYTRAYDYTLNKTYLFVCEKDGNYYAITSISCNDSTHATNGLGLKSAIVAIEGDAVTGILSMPTETEDEGEAEVSATPIPTADPSVPYGLPDAADNKLYINEACASNDTGITDSLGNRYDWIEIYNGYDYDINLEGMGLSDNISKPFKFVFPSVVIGAGEYLIIYASSLDSNTAYDLHTSFSLSKAGETLVLSMADGTALDVLEMPTMADDISYGRYPDGSSVLYRLTPTPLYTNNDATIAKVDVAEPTFSVESGFYQNEFNLTLSADSGLSIYYTTDGSDPTTESEQYLNEILIRNNSDLENKYSAITGLSVFQKTFVPSITIDKNMIVRAIAVDADGNESDIVTKSYFIGFENEAYYNNVPIISLVTDPDNLFGYENGIMMLGKTYDDWVAAGGNESNVTYGTPANYNNRGDEWERKAHLDYFDENGNLVVNQDVGIRVRGNLSRAYVQKSFNIYARSEYGNKNITYDMLPTNIDEKGNVVDKYKSFVLRNGGNLYNSTKYVDSFIQDQLLDRDITTLRSRVGILFLDGEYWGPYMFEEKLAADSLEAKYGIPADDIIIYKNGAIVDGVEEDKELVSAFRQFCSTTDFTDEDAYAELATWADIDALVDFYAATIYMDNQDLANNCAIWRTRNVDPSNPLHDGRWRFYMFDVDNSFYSANASAFNYCLDHAYLKQVVHNEDFKQRLATAILDIGNVNFNKVDSIAAFDQWDEQLRPLMYDYNDRFGAPWGTGLEAYDEVYRSRTNAIKNKMDYMPGIIIDKLGLVGEKAPVTINADPEKCDILLNTTKPNISSGTFEGNYITTYPITITAEAKKGYVFSNWEAEGATVDDSKSETATFTLTSSENVITANFVLAEETPVEISTSDDLFAVASKINSGEDSNAYYILTADIDMSGVDFTAIGTAENPFDGTFNGNSHVIKNVTINSTIQGQGVFGYTGSNAVITELGVENITINGGKNVGAIVGNNSGHISDCYSTGTLSGNSTVGGIVGNNVSGTVENCFSVAEVNSLSASTLGGIAGKTEVDSSVINCYSLITPVAKVQGTVDSATRTISNTELTTGTVKNLLGELWTQGICYPVFSSTYKAPAVAISINDGKATVSSNVGLYADVIIASYDKSILKEAKIIKVLGETTVEIPSTMDGEIKAYLVNDLSNIRPLI